MTSPMLPHRMTRGYGEPIGQVVESVDGTKIKNLRHLVETIRDGRDDFLTFRFAEDGAETIGLPPQGDARRDRAADEPERHPAPRQRRCAGRLGHQACRGPRRVDDQVTQGSTPRGASLLDEGDAAHCPPLSRGVPMAVRREIGDAGREVTNLDVRSRAMRLTNG